MDATARASRRVAETARVSFNARQEE